jgi:hypothetical protein
MTPVSRAKFFLFLFSFFLLLFVAAVAAQDDSPAAIARAALAKLDGFDATYSATTPSGKTFTVRVRQRRPNKMRVDVEPLGLISLFDGRRYLYFERDTKRAIGMTVEDLQAEMRQQRRTLGAMSWFAAAAGRADADEAIYPSLTLGLAPERLDVALEMSSTPEQYSWLRSLAAATAPTRTGDQVAFDETAGKSTVRIAVNLADGLLERVAFVGGNDPAGALVRTSLQKGPPDSSDFDIAAVGGEAAGKPSDRVLLQQALIAGCRGNLDRVLAVAKERWPAFTAEEKEELPRAVAKMFGQIFGLTLPQTRAGLAESLRHSELPAKVASALHDVTANAKFAADHPALKNEALAAAWKRQVVEETTRSVMYNLLHTANEQFVEPFRQQALDATGGMKDEPRRDLIAAVVQPIFRVFSELLQPTVVETLNEMVK